MTAQGADYVAKTHRCPDCGDKSNLVVRWNGRQDEVICWGCKRTDGFIRRESVTALWRRDPEAVPFEIRNKLEHKYGGVEPMSEQAMVVANEGQMLQRIEGARWLAELQPRDRKALAQLSVQYGLDPLMKELTLYEGAPYITVAGMIRIAHRQRKFAGVEDRPMTEEERRTYGYKAPFCWIVKVYRSDWRVPAVGTGQADPGAPFRNNPIERQRPEWMARSRAMRQALKLAFPHSLPFEEMAATEGAAIDPETGEIFDSPEVIETPATVIEEPQVVEEFVEPMTPEPPKPANGNRRATLLQRWETLWREAHELGLEVEAIGVNTTEEEITERGKALAGRIKEAKDKQATMEI